MQPTGDVAVVIPARNESDRIGETVAAAAGLPGVDIVIVVDDGSDDGTAAAAERAGASVVRHARNRGKAAAMETGAEAIRLLEASQANGAGRASGRGQASGPGKLSGAAGSSGVAGVGDAAGRSEEHTSELQSRRDLVCRLLLEKKKGTASLASGGAKGTPRWP